MRKGIKQMIKMTEKLKERISHILSALDKEYGTDFICYLNYETPAKLLMSGDLKCPVYRCQSEYCNSGSV